MSEEATGQKISRSSADNAVPSLTKRERERERERERGSEGERGGDGGGEGEDEARRSQAKDNFSAVKRLADLREI
jgi:hypothetical protein